jgi:hypothetical protein
MTSRRAAELRPAIVLSAMLIAAMFAVREQATRAPVGHALHDLGAIWPDQPRIAQRRLEIASARAAVSGSVHDRDVATARRLLKSDPMGATGLLFIGAERQVSGNPLAAEPIYALAVAREPRDPAARVIFANILLQRGAARPALEQIIALSRLDQGSSELMLRAIAIYARMPGAVEQMRPVLANDPAIRDHLLNLLANDPSNASVILSLAPPSNGPIPESGWQQSLLHSFVSANQIGQARQLWTRLTGRRVPTNQLPETVFRNSGLPKPFVWQLLPSSAGVAEIGRQGGLDLVYYGREDGEFARQLMTLEPGKYQLTSKADAASSADGLYWRIRCLVNTGETLIGLRPGTTGAGTFDVPKTCGSQWIELIAKAPESQQSVELRLVSVEVERVAP